MFQGKKKKKDFLMNSRSSLNCDKYYHKLLKAKLEPEKQ